MNLIRENKVKLEFNGVDEIKLITSIFQKCTTKQAPASFLIRNNKNHFTPQEKEMITRISDRLDQIQF